MSESTSAALDYLRADRVPAVVLSPHVDADAEVVMAAADHVAELLPKPPRTYSIGERLDGITLERLKALGRAVI
ncbi:MAG: hypothetical protein ACYC6C_14750 [Coriobacteriia bacterium]